MPSRAFAVVRILRTGRRNMPSARTPDPAPAGASPRSATSPSPAGKAGPRPGSSPTGPPSASPSARAPAPAPAFGGLRLVEVPGGWPPYDCEVPRHRVPGGARGIRAEPVCPPGLGSTSRCRASRSFSHVQRGPPGRRGGGSRRRADPVVAWSRQFAQVIAEILAGAPVAETLAPWTTEPVRDRISLLTQTLTPGQRPRIRRIVTSRPATRVVEMSRRAQFWAAVPRTGAAPGAAARPSARPRAARPPGAVALHRNRGRLAPPVDALCGPQFHSGTISITYRAWVMAHHSPVQQGL